MDSLSGIGFKVFIIKPLANAETLAHLPGVHTKKTPKTSIIGITNGTTKTHLSWVYSVFCVYFGNVLSRDVLPIMSRCTTVCSILYFFLDICGSLRCVRLL